MSKTNKIPSKSTWSLCTSPKTEKEKRRKKFSPISSWIKIHLGKLIDNLKHD